MLRIGFLPSDFNPMVLILGEAEDFLALAGVLRRFARKPEPIRLDTLPFTQPGGARLILTEAEQQSRVELVGGAPVWRLASGIALRFASQLDTLADPAMPAGSEMLECGTGEEIPVKASRGEYTDDFLLPLRCEPMSDRSTTPG
jgi:hypothetical protein